MENSAAEADLKKTGATPVIRLSIYSFPERHTLTLSLPTRLVQPRIFVYILSIAMALPPKILIVGGGVFGRKSIPHLSAMTNGISAHSRATSMKSESTPEPRSDKHHQFQLTKPFSINGSLPPGASPHFANHPGGISAHSQSTRLLRGHITHRARRLRQRRI